MSRFMANRPISVSIAKPSVTTAGAELLVVPDDLIEVERNLLLGLEPDDVGDLLFLDGRQLDETGQTALTGHADGHDVAAEGVARQELVERLAGQLVGVGVGLAEDFGMLDVIEGGGDELSVDHFKADGLEAALPEIDAPDAGLHWHESYLPPALGEDA